MVELTKEMCEQLMFSKLNMILKGRNGFYLDSTMISLRKELEELTKLYPNTK
jgi:hypothetical protein